MTVDLPPSAGRGWRILILAFIAQMFAIGTASYGFGLLVKPIAAEFGLSRANANMGLVILLVGMAAASPLIGRALDRYPPRYVLQIGAAMLGGGCILIAFANSLWAMAAIAFLLAAGGAAALGPLTSATLAIRGFPHARGRALGIIATASSAGGVAVVPILSLLIDSFGWRHGLALQGCIILFGIGGLSYFLLPKDRGEAVGESPVASALPEPSWPYARLFRTRDFWLMAACFGTLMGVAQAVTATFVAYGTDRGFTLDQATWLISICSAAAIVGKLVVGAVSDWIERRLLLRAVAALDVLYLAILMALPAYPMLMAAAAIMGFSAGAVLPLWTGSISERFGAASYGSVMGAMIVMQLPLAFACMRYAGHSFDTTGHYDGAFAAFIVLTVLAVLVIQPVRRREGLDECRLDPAHG